MIYNLLGDGENFCIDLHISFIISVAFLSKCLRKASSKLAKTSCDTGSLLLMPLRRTTFIPSSGKPGRNKHDLSHGHWNMAGGDQTHSFPFIGRNSDH